MTGQNDALPTFIINIPPR